MYTFNAITTKVPKVPLKWVNQLVSNSVCLCTCVYVHIHTRVCKVPKTESQSLWTRGGERSQCTRLVQETACLCECLSRPPRRCCHWACVSVSETDPGAVERDSGLKPNRSPSGSDRQRWGSTGKGAPPRRAGTTAVPMKGTVRTLTPCPGRSGARMWLWKINHKDVRRESKPGSLCHQDRKEVFKKTPKMQINLISRKSPPFPTKVYQNESEKTSYKRKVLAIIKWANN